MTDLIRKSDALAVVLLGGSPVGMSNRIAALPAVTVGADAVLDAAHAYLVQQYGASPLAHPIDRARILAALEPVAAPDLSDPVTVHANMLRGTIAKPTVEQIVHLYGVDALTKALAPVIVREAALTPTAVDDSQTPDPAIYAGLSGIWSSSIHATHAAPDPAHHVNETPKTEHDADNALTDAYLIARLREIQGQAGLFASAAADRLSARPARANPPSCALAVPTDAARDVLAERARQVSAEGWTPDHDDEHDSGELARAAATYAMVASAGVVDRGDNVPTTWPWDRAWWKPSTSRRDLVKAGALILAEIERMDRADLRALIQKGAADDRA